MPPITKLLKGQAVKVRSPVTRVTAIRGSAFLIARAAVAPAKPPPTTTTRGAACASTGTAARAQSAVADAPDARNSRRVEPFALMARGCSFPLCVPIGDVLDLGIGEAFGNAIHHSCGLLSGFEGLHLCDDICGRPAEERRDGRVSASDRVAARARRGARWWLGRSSKRRQWRCHHRNHAKPNAQGTHCTTWKQDMREG